MSVLLLTGAICSSSGKAYLGSASMGVERQSCQICANLCFCGRSFCMSNKPSLKMARE